MLYFILFLDQKTKEEAAVRQAHENARDQADAGTPSREEAGKCQNKMCEISKMK